MKLLSMTIIVLGMALCAFAGGKNTPAQSRSRVDGELVYKTNCTRCHNTPPSLTERQSKAVALHMRVRANLLAEQADAVRRYLAESARK
jgi:cytochrome c5